MEGGHERFAAGLSCWRTLDVAGSAAIHSRFYSGPSEYYTCSPTPTQSPNLSPTTALSTAHTHPSPATTAAPKTAAALATVATLPVFPNLLPAVSAGFGAGE